MKNYEAFSRSPLFDKISPEDIQKLCKCIDAKEKHIEKDEFVFRAGDDANSIYMILEGSMHIIDEDFWGNRSIIEAMEAYTLFGEAYAIASTEKYFVSVIAAKDSIVLEMKPAQLFEVCPNGCNCHLVLIKNTMYILSEKIVRLTGKVGHIIKRNMREKILSYLSQCARQSKSSSFDIPYSRQQLADYLCVDRSALSHELAKMRSIGIVRYHKNHFELVEKP